MKSTTEQLIKRGFLSEIDYNNLLTSEMNISEYIDNTKAVYRTCAYRILKRSPNNKYLELICERLKFEKALYSKIELCECIVEYGNDAILYLDKLIGVIGNNQHKAIGNYDLNKKSFPLPRDIAARTMIRMGVCVLKYYKSRLSEYEDKQLSEIIDVIGHISFTTGDQTLSDDLITEYNKRNSNTLIKWKIIKSFQSFDNRQIKNNLLIEQNSSNEIIAKEAQRSLKRINERKDL